MSLRQIGRSAAQDLVLLLEQLDPLARLPQRVGLATRLWRARRPGRVLLVDRQPALQARRRDTEVLGDLGHRGIGLPVDPDHVLAKLLGERLRHDAHPSSADTHRRRSDVTYPCSSPVRQNPYLGPRRRNGPPRRHHRPHRHHNLLRRPLQPHQRPSNENTNGLLREYLPKGADLSTFTRADLDHIANELNDRPRKRLGYHTPKETLAKLTTQNQTTQGVMRCC